MSEPSANGADVPVKRPRGRPRKHPLVGHKQSKETIEKRKATIAARRAAKRAAREGSDSNANATMAGRVEDAIIYLRKGMSLAERAYEEGRIKKSRAFLLMFDLALKTLEGEL